MGNQAAFLKIFSKNISKDVAMNEVVL